MMFDGAVQDADGSAAKETEEGGYMNHGRVENEVSDPHR
jgi:hypothetical protein